MSSFDQTRYEAENKKAHDFYESIKEIASPVLGSVHFNSEGFMHILFGDTERNEKRDWKDQIKRFELFRNVPHLLKNMAHYQEYDERMERVEMKMNKERMTVVKRVRYWGFVAIIKNDTRRIKIVLRQVGEGKIHFWSVIPAWKTKHYKDINKIEVTLHKGDLAKD